MKFNMKKLSGGKAAAIICASALVLTTVAGAIGSGAVSAPQNCYVAESSKELSYGGMDDGDMDASAESVSKAPVDPTANRVVIRNADLRLETSNYPKLQKSIASKVESLYGYTVNVNESGSGTENDRYSARIIVKVPSDKLDEFIEYVGKEAVVTSKTVSQNDITSDYVDTESHINTLKTEQATLLELLKKASSLSDTIQIQDRLTEVRQQLEYYEGMMAKMENDVSYSTVDMDIREVEREKAEGSGFLYDIKTGLSDSLYNIGEGFKVMIVWFVSALPVIAIFGVFGIVVVKIVKAVRRKRGGKESGGQGDS